jgi:Tol biopolymer transport system component
MLFTRPAWSPDGTSIAFSGLRGADATSSQGDIYTVGSDGGRSRRVTHVRDADNPVWRPDGRWIVFTRRQLGRNGGVSGGLWTVQPNGSGLKRLTAPQQAQLDTAGSFSPRGDTIAFTRSSCDAGKASCVSGTSDVYLANADGSHQRVIVKRAADPAFAPDGSRIAFDSDRDANGELNYGDQTEVASELYVTRTDGRGGLTRLTHTRAINERHPAWMVNGARLVFQRGSQVDNAEATSILEMNSDGSCQHAILADPHFNTWYASPAPRPGMVRRGRRLTC